MQASPNPTNSSNAASSGEEQFEALLRACAGLQDAGRADAWFKRKGPGRPSHDEIAARAYQLFLARGGLPGHDLDDWLEAERQL